MGLGIAVAGGIICVTMIAVLSIVYSMSGQIFDINSSRTSSVDVQNTIFQTNMTIANITATSGNQYVNFTLTNRGNEKLWNYAKFDVVINYTANVLGLPTQATTRLTYDSASSFLGATSTKKCTSNGNFVTYDWILGGILSNYVEPSIINTNEVAIICTKLPNPVYTKGKVQVTVTTDAGFTNNNSTNAS